MRASDAVAMLEGVDLASGGSTTWADLGSGDGTFTRALASRLAPGSVIHAVDHDEQALRAIPARVGDTAIRTHAADFTAHPWPFRDLDGILMANSLHYVARPAEFIRGCAPYLRSGRFVVVEYDTKRANPWVPHPLDRDALAAAFRRAGYTSIRFLGSRPSIYRRAALYSAVIEP